MRYTLTKITSLKTAEDFRSHVASLGINVGLDDELLPSESSPICASAKWQRLTVGNRIAIQPMEGWDGTTTGGASEATYRRWRRFGASGAKLIWGGEAMAVRPDGRANPNQLILQKQNASDIAKLRGELIAAHEEQFGTADGLVVGFQLTHSGRFCRPNQKHVWEPKVAYRHPLLDARFGVVSENQVFSNVELSELIEDYVEAAKLAEEIGANFVDIKCCHGYLLHEFLSARSRPGCYGGSLENRSRLLLEIIDAVRSAAPSLQIGVRLSAFDSVPFQADPTTAEAGKQGQGMPVPHEHFLPYKYGFGVDEALPTKEDLTETKALIRMLLSHGVGLMNISAGSPYYTPHLVRPAAYPPSDGYQPHEDPLMTVARHLRVVSDLKQTFPEMLFVGSGYSYLQEFLPNVAQYQLRNESVDFVGMGRMVLSYPNQIVDAVEQRPSERKLVCRTFSDCTTAPRNGLPSGCYPLDEYYKKSEDAQRLKDIKAGAKGN